MISKWQWMMNYCSKKKIPPAHIWAWEEAKKAYDEFIKTKEAPK